MTLILAIPASDGLVLASDGQITTGLVRAPGKKIYPLGEKAAWAAAGELALVQRLEEKMAALPVGRSLANLRDDIGQMVKQCLAELMQLDFRASYFATDPDTLVKLHPGDFVFGEFAQGPHILHITADGVPEWINEAPFAGGSGDLFAYALLRKYQGRDLDLPRAALLACKVMEEAIAVDAYGLGPPIDIWKLTEQGIRNLSEAEVEELAARAARLREAEVKLLLDGDILPGN